ncbi:MAG TPA: amino acid ABC transporter permease [Gammaproteobacteria bacterium]|nr:amino acid ABC transporter permease [Gammaproteobacteria bacterium]
MAEAKSIEFVRSEMLGEKPPPLTSVGVIGWMRQNLFSDLLSTFLTLVALYLIYSVLAGVLPWMFRGVWEAGSLGECREIIADKYGEGVAAACWAVIRERFWQLMYGFYPSHLYWRPNLALILLFAALAPVLFDKAPRWMLVFTVAVPFVGPWLLWGGSIWVPVMAFMGFVIGVLVNRFVGQATSSLLGLLAAVAAAIVWWLFLAGPAANALASAIPLGIEAVESRQFGGFMLAVTLGITGIALSFPLGIVLALGRQSNLVIVKSLCVGFIEFIRGVPLITLLFVASVLLNYFLPKGTQFDIILRVMIMITLFSAAYMAEVIRGGLAALPKGQYEAADALGLTYWQAQRLIIMPQALKIAIPGIVSSFIGLFKDTTLVSIIGLSDPIGWAKLIQANSEWNGIVWELYGFIAFVFFLFCFSMGRYSMYLERKLQTGH